MGQLLSHPSAKDQSSLFLSIYVAALESQIAERLRSERQVDVRTESRVTIKVS